MRVVFLGNCDDSAEFLEALVARSNDPTDQVELMAVISPQSFGSRRDEMQFAAKRRVDRTVDLVPDKLLPDKLLDRMKGSQAGLGQRMQQLADNAAATILWPSKVSEPEVCHQIERIGADITIVAGLSEILRGPVFDAFPPLFNIHPSLLPEFRGGVPEFWQLDSGATEGGVTIHRLDQGVDTGAIVLQKPFAIEPWLDSSGLIAQATTAGIELMNRLLDGFPTIVDQARSQEGGSYQRLPTPDDYLVPFGRPAASVFNRARAAGFGVPLVLHVPRHGWESARPLIGSDTSTAETLTLKLSDPIPFPDHTEGAPGELRRVPAGGVAVTCNPGTVVFREALVA